MLDSTSSLTVQARLPNPYVHVDNRGLILCNGPRCVCIPASGLRACAETLEIIATREARDAHPGPAPRRRLHRRRLRGPVRGHPGRPRLGQPEQLGVRRAASGARRDEAPARRRRGTARVRGAGERGGEVADAVLAADRLRALRAQVDHRDAEGRRPRGARRARLRARVRRAGAGGQQGPGRRAAAGEQDDGPPPPVLHGRADGREPGLPRLAVPGRARGGAPRRPVRGGLPPGDAGALRRPQRQRLRSRARVVGDGDGHEPLPALQALLRAHEGLVHDRAARGRLPDHGRQLQAPAQRHGLRRAGRRRDLHRPLDVDGALQRPHPRRRLAPPRRRDAPDARL